MAINRTTLLDLPLPVTGTESGTWGDVTNNGLSQYLDIAIAGVTSLTSANFTSGALTIETTEGTSTATNIVATSAQYATIRVSSLAVNSTITVGNTGANLGRSYRLINDDSTYTLTFKATGQTGITLQPGQSAVVAFNGTDYALVGTIGPTVPVARGGTGATTLTGLLKGNGTSAFTAATAGTDYVAPGTATTFTANQTFNSTRLILAGSTSGTSTLNAAAVAGTTTLTLPDQTATLGYINAPQSTTTTLALTDQGKHVIFTGGSTATLTVPTNSSVAFPIGTVILVVNDNNGNLTIEGAGVTLQLANGSTGNRTVATKGLATCLKTATDTWYVSGAGVT